MEIYEKFLNQYDFDIRKSGDARWIDQKCTYDVVSIIADCINEYVETMHVDEFTVSDIWHSDYARENVIAIFSKPDPELKAGNEYDKYFGQPIKLLGYSKILNVRKEKNRYYYSINNKDVLNKIALRPMNALNFLYYYICKVLNDSGLMVTFEEFFRIQDKDSYKDVRDRFIQFTINHTKINGETECGRIFTKVINPLAFKLRKLGTEKGRISKYVITLNDLQYNRSNWRDELSGKEKSITRSEFELTTSQLQARALANYTVNKAKKAVRKFNDAMFDGKSEVSQPTEIVNATQVHHIFAQSEFPDIADYVENLIMLTPNQHFSMAHPNNNTQYIDKDFQYICLLAKSTKIHMNLTSTNEEKFYDFDDYKYVLNTGLNTDEFSSISNLDFASIVNKIDYFYEVTLETNKYCDLVQYNRFSI
ncbi:restriction endonuclease [Pasteurellaceae bacterium Macca]|nr:restriction endonuclease [Pasteurellaceae bacterium Macca]